MLDVLRCHLPELAFGTIVAVALVFLWQILYGIGRGGLRGENLFAAARLQSCWPGADSVAAVTGAIGKKETLEKEDEEESQDYWRRKRKEWRTANKESGKRESNFWRETVTGKVFPRRYARLGARLVLEGYHVAAYGQQQVTSRAQEATPSLPTMRKKKLVLAPVKDDTVILKTAAEDTAVVVPTVIVNGSDAVPATPTKKEFCTFVETEALAEGTTN